MSINSVCVYCGSSSRVDDKFKKLAQETGRALAKAGKAVIYGGGHVGLMGLMANAALAEGGKVIGIIPEHIRAYEIEHKGLSELCVVNGMHERKRLMAERADAFAVLPGGFGTLDETFEIITWKYLGLHNKPIVIFNLDGYWDPLVTLTSHLVENGFAPPSHACLFKVVTDIKGLFEALAEPQGSLSKPSEKWA